MGIFDDITRDFKQVINDNTKVDVAYLENETNGNTLYNTKKILIDTSSVLNTGVGINKPYIVNFPFKKISFIDISTANGLYNPRLDVTCTIVFGRVGDTLASSETIVMRLGDVIEFDEIQKACYFYFTNSSVRCTLLFSMGLKMQVSNNVVFLPNPQRTLQSTPVLVTNSRNALVSNSSDLRGVHLYNESTTDTIYVGSSSVTVANGFPIKPQAYYFFESAGALSGITEPTKTATMRIIATYL